MKVQHPNHPLLDGFLWLLVLVMALIVVYTSVSVPGDGTFPLSDKLMHFLAYLGLTCSTLLAAVWAPLRGEGRFPTSALPIAVLAFLFGVAIEVVQGPLPGRDAELLDAFANAGGTLTALGAWTLLRLAVAERTGPARG